MSLTRYGSDVLWTVLLLAIVLLGLTFWTHELWLRIVLLGITVFMVGFTLNFFRDPDRTIDANGKPVSRLIVCPADGKVVAIAETNEAHYLHGTARCISIFMSPLNVHVNRAPITGVVRYVQKIDGEFLVASDPEASHRNERAIIGIEDANGVKVVLAQVAGYVARRIVCPLKAGDSVNAGERFGMIKFGSRVDIWIPLNAKLMVNNGDVVSAGQTILAEMATE